MREYDNPVVQEDMSALAASGLPLGELTGRTVLITGATGMLASYFAFLLLYLNEHRNADIQLVLLARSRDKLVNVYGKQPANTRFLIQDVCEPIGCDQPLDYILHAAGGASPDCIRNDPVGVINANTQGTSQVLGLARQHDVRKVLFTSTREVYGRVENCESITEADMGVLDPVDPRSCYPESKRLAEALFQAHSTQYGTPYALLRIAHSYGPGMRIHDDGRVMSDLMSDAVHGRDIYLKSAGQVNRAFCYITDAIDAMFRTLLLGGDNTVYNVANEAEPVKIIDLAKLLQQVAGTEKGVLLPADDIDAGGYTNYKRVLLDTSRLERLGWLPKVHLRDGLKRTLLSFRS